MEKVRILYEISKGCNVYGIHPTAEVPNEMRRIPFDRMIYCGDGASDVWAWSKIKKSGGQTVGVWDPDTPASWEYLEIQRQAGNLSHVGMADFSPTSSTGGWIINMCTLLQHQSETRETVALQQKIAAINLQRPEFLHPWSKKRLS